MRYVNTEKTYFGIVNEHTPTVNHNNEAMTGVEESIRELFDHINIEECIDSGE